MLAPEGVLGLAPQRHERCTRAGVGRREHADLQSFQGDVPLQVRLPSLINHTLAAPAGLPDQLEVAQLAEDSRSLCCAQQAQPVGAEPQDEKGAQAGR